MTTMETMNPTDTMDQITQPSSAPDLAAAVAKVDPSPETAFGRKRVLPANPSRLQRAVVVHAGRRDSYQLALGLQEAGLLEVLVTDLFWSGERGWARRLYAVLPGGVQQKLLLRSEPLLDARRVRTSALAGLSGLLLDKATMLPFPLRRWLTRKADAHLGSTAGRLAKAKASHLVSYSYYGFDAFRALGRADILFQMHPHPATMRRLLRDEMLRHPESAASLSLEWELALPDSDFEHLVAESQSARAFLVASSVHARQLDRAWRQPGSHSRGSLRSGPGSVLPSTGRPSEAQGWSCAETASGFVCGSH